MNLSAINQAYEQILHDQSLTAYEKDLRFAELMTTMEREFGVPALQSNEYERNNKAVIALYRKISLSRSL